MTVLRRPSLAVLMIVVAGAACGGSETAVPSDTEPSDTVATTAVATTAEVSAAASESTVSTGPVAIRSVDTDVGYYPACGNEVLDFDGVRWHQIDTGATVPEGSDLAARIDVARTAEREPLSSRAPQGLARVADPGPGDDVGTLVVWEDGIARWFSDSGLLDVMLIDAELTFEYAC